MPKENECVGSYEVSGYTRQDGTEVSGYKRRCGAKHVSQDDKYERRADVLYPNMPNNKKQEVPEESKKQGIGLGVNVWDIFIKNKRDMDIDNTKNADKYFHSKANCEAAQAGQQVGAVALSLLKEAYDIPKKIIIDGKPINDTLKDSKEDLNEDFYGLKQGTFNPNIECKYLVDEYRVEGINPKY